jgi:hypothetical protein
MGVVSMNAIPDFEDLLRLLGKHDVRYLVIVRT